MEAIKEELDIHPHLAYARRRLENKTLEEIRQCIRDLQEELKKSIKFYYTQEDSNQENKIRFTLAEAKRIERYMERDDLETPTKLTAGYVLSDFGTELDEIEPFTTELTKTVNDMKEKLVSESKLLEGTEIAEREEIVIPMENAEEVMKRIRFSPETECKE